MFTKKRIIITLVLLIVLTLTAVLTEIGQMNYEQTCVICQSKRDMQERHYFVFGASWTDSETSNESTSPFLKQFPEYHCSHHWNADVDESPEFKFLWDSPIIRVYPFNAMYTAPNAIIDGYNHSEKFRLLVDKLIAEKKITREKLLALSKNACMDGGTCQMNREDPVESVLLEAIYEFWRSPAYQDRYEK